MTTTAVIVLVVAIGYLGFVAFVIGLLMVARHADEETERHLRAVGARPQRFARPDAGREVEDTRRSEHPVG